MEAKLFLIAWAFLLVVVVVAQFVLGGKLKKRAGIIHNFLVAAPYLIVFSWFAARDRIGTYKSNSILETLGLSFMIFGIIGYVSSIFFLRHNWTISAAIKEKQTIVKEGPYKYIRHPMYSFMIIVVFGSGLLISNYLILLYTPIIGVLYYLRAKKEEDLLKETFPEYNNYIRETKMLIPGIF